MSSCYECIVLVIAGGICLLGLAVFLSLFVLFRDHYAIHSLTNTLSNYKLTNNKSKKTKKRKTKWLIVNPEKTDQTETKTSLEDLPWESIFTINPPPKPILPDPVSLKSTNIRLCKW